MVCTHFENSTKRYEHSSSILLRVMLLTKPAYEVNDDGSINYASLLQLLACCQVTCKYVADLALRTTIAGRVKRNIVPHERLNEPPEPKRYNIEKTKIPCSHCRIDHDPQSLHIPDLFFRFCTIIVGTVDNGIYLAKEAYSSVFSPHLPIGLGRVERLHLSAMVQISLDQVGTQGDLPLL